MTDHSTNSSITSVDTIINSVHIASMDEKITEPYGTIRDAAIGITDGKISWLGSNHEAENITANDTIAGESQWLTPGLIDCHTHLVYGGNRAEEFELKLSGATYEELSKKGGGIVSTVNATRSLSEQALFDASAPRLQKLLAEGVTTVEIKSGYGLNLSDEMKMLRVARKLHKSFPVDIKTTFLGAHALPSDFDNKDSYIQFLIDTVLPEVSSQGLADAVDFFCEGIGFSRDQCSRYAQAATELGLPVKGHVEQLSYLAGAKLVAEFGGLSVDHLEYLPEDDIPVLKDANLVAVLLPGAFYSLRETKMPPIKQMLEHELPIAIASDLNPGSSPIASLLNVMNLACVLYKMTPEVVLRGVTANAARALGEQSEVGKIRKGLKADLALWPIDSPAQLCYGMNLVKPSMVFKEGRCVKSL